MEQNNPLITKWRPAKFAEVVGNEIAIQKLQDAVTSNSYPRTYLFAGPSGLGKTTLAHIIASMMNAHVVEIDAASNSGVDDMRKVVESSKFKHIGHQPNKMYIIDECHNLSSKGWEPLLALTEKPPDGVFIALATTKNSNIPETIRTRCYQVALKPLKTREMEDYVTQIAELEGWTITDSTFQAIVQASTGQPRKALSILWAGHSVTDREQLAEIIMGVESDNSPIIAICSLLLQGGTSWERIVKELNRIDENSLDIIGTATRYTLAALLKCSDPVSAKRAWGILNSITASTSTFDERAKFVNAVGNIIFQ